MYGNKTSLSTDGIMSYLANIGVTTVKAETWRSWATIYVEMELDADQMGPHASKYS
jgi:hypothetical protein